MQGCDVIASSSLSTSDKVHPTCETTKMDACVLEELGEQEWQPVYSSIISPLTHQILTGCLPHADCMLGTNIQKILHKDS